MNRTLTNFLMNLSVALLILLMSSISLAANNGVITGKVTEQRLDTPIDNAEVKVIGYEFRTTTDSKGNFQLAVPAGVWDVKISARFNHPLTYTGVYVDSLHSASLTCKMVRLEDRQDYPILEYTGRNLSSPMSGLVIDATTGDPVVSASINLLETFLSAETDSSGAFTIKNVPYGVHSIFISATGYQMTLVNECMSWQNSMTFFIIPTTLENDTLVVSYQIMLRMQNSESWADVPRKATSVVQEDVEIVEDIALQVPPPPGNSKKATAQQSEMHALKAIKPEMVADVVVSMRPRVRFDGVQTAFMRPSVSLPFVPNGESYGKFAESQFLEVSDSPLSTFSIDVDKASYANVRRFLNDGQLPPTDAVRIEEMINYFNYNYPQPKGKDVVSITLESHDCPWNADDKLVLVGLQAKDIEQDKRPPSNLVFLIDVSGSMNSPDKLPLLKNSMNLLVDEIDEYDRITIVVYSGAARVHLEPTLGDQKEVIHNAINLLQSGGSTAGAAGIQLAYQKARESFLKKGNNRVLLATDGDFNVGTRDNDELVNIIQTGANEEVFLTVLGFGTGNIQDDRMEYIADKGDGNYYYIDSILEGKKALIEEAGGLFTIAKDVKIQVEFNPAIVRAYRLIGYENRALADRDFNDDTKDAGEIGMGQSVTALYELVMVGMDDHFTPPVDPLKYQKVEATPTSDFTDEVMTVKFRYKPLESDKSLKFTTILKDKDDRKNKVSDNFKLASAVAEFGMFLRQSQNLPSFDSDKIIKTIRSADSFEPVEIRGELIQLIKLSSLLGAKNK